MPLSAGSVLASYEITGLLGTGGMGEVYRARDNKLNRHVAIKVLPEEFANDPERIARFHREAQSIAALNHPNIAAIYELAESAGTRFLVLELVEGDTLAERLRRGPLSIEDALNLAKQIAEALEAANEKGIVHRDLKPGNVKITPEGKVKVLDFGLAKMRENAPSNAIASNSPTLSLAGTVPGVILGTAAYMSPEQAKGFDADHRSDIFSFGSVLYEMLTGRPAFDGDTISEILASVFENRSRFESAAGEAQSAYCRTASSMSRKEPEAPLACGRGCAGANRSSHQSRDHDGAAADRGGASAVEACDSSCYRCRARGSNRRCCGLGLQAITISEDHALSHPCGGRSAAFNRGVATDGNFAGR